MSSKRLPADRCVIRLWRGYVKAQFYVPRRDGGDAFCHSPMFTTWRPPWRTSIEIRDDPAALKALAALEEDPGREAGSERGGRRAPSGMSFGFGRLPRLHARPRHPIYDRSRRGPTIQTRSTRAFDPPVGSTGGRCRRDVQRRFHPRSRSAAASLPEPDFAELRRGCRTAALAQPAYQSAPQQRPRAYAAGGAAWIHVKRRGASQPLVALGHSQGLTACTGCSSSGATVWRCALAPRPSCRASRFFRFRTREPSQRLRLPPTPVRLQWFASISSSP